jgi:hypothetical protein
MADAGELAPSAMADAGALAPLLLAVPMPSPLAGSARMRTREDDANANVGSANALVRVIAPEGAASVASVRADAAGLCDDTATRESVLSHSHPGHRCSEGRAASLEIAGLEVQLDQARQMLVAKELEDSDVRSGDADESDSTEVRSEYCDLEDHDSE